MKLKTETLACIKKIEPEMNLHLILMTGKNNISGNHSLKIGEVRCL